MFIKGSRFGVERVVALKGGGKKSGGEEERVVVGRSSELVVNEATFGRKPILML